jgi:hypothetical protein
MLDPKKNILLPGAQRRQSYEREEKAYPRLFMNVRQDKHQKGE